MTTPDDARRNWRVAIGLMIAVPLIMLGVCVIAIPLVKPEEMQDKLWRLCPLPMALVMVGLVKNGYARRRTLREAEAQNSDGK